MKNNVEKRFFKTFGIEKNIIPSACSNRIEDCCNKDYCCTAFDKENNKRNCLEYPEITDRILLELICMLVNFGTSITLVKGRVDTNVEALKRLVLNAYITTKGIDKEKVRALFEGVEQCIQ